MAVPSSDAPAAGGHKVARRYSPWRAVKWLGGSAIVALAGWTAVEIAQYGFDRLFREQPPPIEEQVRSVLVEAAEDGYRATTNRLLDFDGDGSMSRLIILRTVERGRQTVASADEVRIYDIEASRLKLTFRFRPQRPEKRRAGAPVNSPPFALQLTEARDLDGNGTEEAILQLMDGVPGGPSFGEKLLRIWTITRPLMLVWDFERRRYSVVPLLSPGITGRRGPRLAREKGVLFRSIYQERLTIIDAHSRSRFVTFAAGAIAIHQSREGPLLAAAFDLSKDPVSLADTLYQIHVWRLYPDGLGAPAALCFPLGKALVRSQASPAAMRVALDRVLGQPRVC
jgi:hypothetical protein